MLNILVSMWAWFPYAIIWVDTFPIIGMFESASTPYLFR